MRSDFSLKYEIRPAFGVLYLVRKTHTELLSAVLEGLDAFRYFFKMSNTPAFGVLCLVRKTHAELLSGWTSERRCRTCLMLAQG